jgi:DNA replication regulator DPB11
VVLCPSGISDITRRTQISKHLIANEGIYLKNLERPVKVTHLLCSGDEETEKMRYAEKFNSRGEAKIHLVWEEWFWDSLNFGGRFDETKYQVRGPRPARKTVGEGIPISSFRLYSRVLNILNNEVSSSPPPPSSELPSQQDGGPSSVSKSKQPQPPQNSLLDEMEDEKAFTNLLPDATLLLWSKLLERRGYQITDGEVILSPSKADVLPQNAKKSDMPSRPSSPHHHASGSIISSLRRAPPVVQAKDPGTSRQLRSDGRLRLQLVLVLLRSVRPLR